MSSRSWGPIVVLAALVAAAVFGYRWWTGDERAIRAQLSKIEEALTVRPDEGSLGPVTRIAVLRNALAPEIRLSIGAPESPDAAESANRIPRDVAGRDAVLGLVSRWIPPAGGITVEFVDVQIEVGDSGDSARVYCTGKVNSRSASGAPMLDAAELVVGFSKIDGEWLVSSVQVEETLIR